MSFDDIIDRSNTGSTKWNKYEGQDVIPLWVADMDFASPPPVLRALSQRVEHGIFGYCEPPEELIDVIKQRLMTMYQWTIMPDDLIFLPGVVPALNMACRGLATSTGRVVTVTPVYHPFLSAPDFAGKELITVSVELHDGHWRYPFEQLESIFQQGADLLLLCNPHNPIGRLLEVGELQQIIALCEKYDVIICADEIHCDLLFDDRIHHPIASLSAAARERTVTLLAPSKTFNIAGIGGAFAVIENPDLREKFQAPASGIGGNVNVFAYPAMLAAYRHCHHWHQDLVSYLQANRDFLCAAIDDIQGISMSIPEATYLGWLDVKELGLNHPDSYFEEHGLGFSPGDQFGGEGFLRMNFGCPRETLERAVSRLADAAGKRG